MFPATVFVSVASGHLTLLAVGQVLQRSLEPAHSRIANGGGRNSSIELLRIIAMFMILAHHFIVHNGYDVLKLPLGPERIFFQLVMAGGGKVVCVQ